jgi:hypothetical protein
MKRRSFLKAIGTSGLMTIVTPNGLVHAIGKTPDKSLIDGFLQPPMAARPHSFWFWMNGHISKEGITRDLEAMKKIGLGGALNFNCGVAIPKGPVVYLSPEWISLMKHAVEEADRLDLEFAMHNSPGWSSSGGPWITPEMSMQTVVWTEKVVKGGPAIKMTLPKPAARLNYYKDTYVLAFPSSPDEIKSIVNGSTPASNSNALLEDTEDPQPLSDINRLQDWQIKAGYKRFKDALMMEPAPFAGAKNRRQKNLVKAAPYEVPKASIIDAGSIVDVSEYMNTEGEINWDAPEGYWTILRLGHTCTGAVNRAAPDTGQGLECDKLSKEAFDMHFNTMFQHLLPFMKSMANKGKIGVEIDSYEVGMQNWTKGFPEAFKKSRGYDIKTFLPALTGRVVNSAVKTEGFLWDLRRVIADLVADNYYGRCAELCKKHNIIFYGEPYKLGPFENMQVASRMENVMGEFWSRGQRNKHTMKLASSAQHVNGKKIVGAEAFTGQPAYSKWQQFPFSLKAQGDLMFTKGLNRMIFHVFAHQSHPTVRPGMTMGQFGTHFDRNNTWFDQGNAWIDYLSRCQFMLQQGLFVADLLYYTGEDGPGQDLGIRETPLPMLPAGYDYDDMNTEVLMKWVRIENGRIVLPDNMSYSLMVLPVKMTITLPVIMKIRNLVRAGMCLAGARPTGIAGLADLKDEVQLKEIVLEIWGDMDGEKNMYRMLGKGKIFLGEPLEDVLNKLNLKPDFDFSSESPDPAINFIHRHYKETDFYFINNRRRRKERIVGLFRVEGRKPEFWNPVTGEITPAPIYDILDGQTRVPFQLEEAGSLFVVFREPASANRLLSLKKDNAEILTVRSFPPKSRAGYKDIINSFTISTWIKPECDIVVSGMNYAMRLDISSYVLYPFSGEKLYGQGHSVCGLTAGRNGMVVYERKGEEVNPVLEIKTPLSGWTHVSLVYDVGLPHVYINGKLAGKGKASSSMVHPCVGEEYQDIYAVYFEGDMTPPILTRSAVSPEQVPNLIKGRPGMAKKYPAVEVASSKNKLLIWENGNYTMQRSQGKDLSLKISAISPSNELKGPLKIVFPPDLGAPPSVTIPKLVSLHRHSNEGVKYFSGTASYFNKFTVAENEIGADNLLYLDLGQVEVLAEVIVNGKNLGVLWTRPYRVDITNAVRIGENSLEVKVTNGWPNRLIGDEQLPDEYDYAHPDSGGIKVMPDWFVQGKPKPEGKRITFATWKHYDKDSPLLEAGLVGPVTLRNAVSYTLM